MSTRTKSKSKSASDALALVEGLQRYIVETLSGSYADSSLFSPREWLRGGGRWGGGERYEAISGKHLQRGSVNVSQVHYDDDDSKKLGSATALSTIIHPTNPHCPSIHAHFSWTEMKDGQGYWRMMADLNPAIPKEEDRLEFEETLEKVSGDHYAGAKKQGEKYFFIPALGRHRGVAHFYLEEFKTADAEADRKLARQIAESVFATYLELIERNRAGHPSPTSGDFAKQLAYHTLYFFQVLTLDRGTTSGILAHADNDIGTLGSLPAKVDRELLRSWMENLPEPQDKLLHMLIDCLADEVPTPVEEPQKAQLAAAMRRYYTEFPDATTFLARGDVAPSASTHHR